MAYNSVTVTDTATEIVGANSSRRNLTIVNNGSNTVFIGPDSSITTANAIPLYASSTRDSDVIPEGYKGAIYGIVESGSENVRYWEENA